MKLKQLKPHFDIHGPMWQYECKFCDEMSDVFPDKESMKSSAQLHICKPKSIRTERLPAEARIRIEILEKEIAAIAREAIDDYEPYRTDL